MDFSTDYIICQNCNEMHEPAIFEEMGISIFEDGDYEADCPNCNAKMKIRTNVITEWGVEAVK